MRNLVVFIFLILFNFSNSQFRNLDVSNDSILNQKYESFIKFKEIKDHSLFNNSYAGFYNDQYLREVPFQLRKYNNYNYLKIETAANNIYGLAISPIGFWLMIHENNKTIPYFIGIAQDQFIHIKIPSKVPMIKNDKLQLECSIIMQTRLGSRPVISNEDLPAYKVLKDNLLLSIDLDLIKKDSDGDGYNDLFEKYIGLNPKSKDSDNDGINDNEDFNPLYKSINNEYTTAFNKTINGGYIHKFENAKTVIEPIFVKEFQVDPDSDPFKFDIYTVENNVLKNIDPKTKRILIFNRNYEKTNFNITHSTYKDIKKTNDNEFKIISAFESGSSSSNISKEGNDWILHLISAAVY
ncbi:hypothetical protein LUD75_14340 [Epilithonimonas sp. JDS]|uniref:hypothetical protein n=1 Tax=Epilithonimonas sp. JDS TaxID=2902797 RepID=UPI001E482D96|nr:hypothetical protein [Epilithonimonas sp. JDS]MCD9855901.1 hypothetical protein [Epilithonimonas sp. JDS]